MTEQTLRRADELLTELVELVETARTLPMSSSSVLPRERVLDLLDELRETLPPEINEARKVLANRDGVLHEAVEEAKGERDRATQEAAAILADAERARETAAQQADTVLADADHRVRELVHDAEVKAYEIVEGGKAEHGHLVSATGVHQAAAQSAAELRESAEAYSAQLRAEAESHHGTLRAEAERYDADTRAEAERYAAKLTGDAEDYADRTLADLAATLQRAAATAEQGRIALAQRRAGAQPVYADADPSISA